MRFPKLNKASQLLLLALVVVDAGLAHQYLVTRCWHIVAAQGHSWVTASERCGQVPPQSVAEELERIAEEAFAREESGNIRP